MKKIFCGLLLLDVLSKFAALEWLPGESVSIGSFGGISFALTLVVNTGAAWGLFEGFPGILFLLRLGMIVFLAKYALRDPKMGLVFVGALGNCLDYLFYGHVIDFLHWTFWGYSFPVFNVADSCITLGVFALLFTPKKVLA